MCCFRIGKFQATPRKQDPGAVRVQGFVSKFPTGSPSFSYGSSFPPEWVGGGVVRGHSECDLKCMTYCRTSTIWIWNSCCSRLWKDWRLSVLVEVIYWLWSTTLRYFLYSLVLYCVTLLVLGYVTLFHVSCNWNRFCFHPPSCFSRVHTDLLWTLSKVSDFI